MLLASFRYAFWGLGYVWRTQRNVKIHAAIAVAVLALAGWLRLPADHWAVLIVCIGIVLAAEVENTVVETLVDLISPEHHHLAKTAKDVSAAAVFILALMAAAVGLLILGPPLWRALFV